MFRCETIGLWRRRRRIHNGNIVGFRFLRRRSLPNMLGLPHMGRRPPPHLPRDHFLRSRSAVTALLQRCDNALDRAKLGADGVELPLTVNKAIGHWIGERARKRGVLGCARRR